MNVALARAENDSSCKEYFLNLNECLSNSLMNAIDIDSIQFNSAYFGAAIAKPKALKAAEHQKIFSIEGFSEVSPVGKRPRVQNVDLFLLF